MMGYGMAKAAVHQLVKSLAGKDSGLPANAHAVAILPYVIKFQLFSVVIRKTDDTEQHQRYKAVIYAQ